MAPDTEHGGVTAEDLESRETLTLIGSDKVEGTDVFNLNGEKIGGIERVMLDKRSGQVAYAVLSFGGFLGIGDDHYPVPWGKLTYDEDLGGYRTDISKQDLDNAPRHDPADDPAWADKRKAMGIYTYYGMPPYWL